MGAPGRKNPVPPRKWTEKGAPQKGALLSVTWRTPMGRSFSGVARCVVVYIFSDPFVFVQLRVRKNSRGAFRKIPYYIKYAPLLFLDFRVKKKLEIREGRHEQWKHTSTPWNYFFSFTNFFLWTFRNIPYYFLLCPVSISRWMNQKKISKFEREVKSNGNTLPHTGFFFSLSLVFLMSIWKDSLALFGMSH